MYMLIVSFSNGMGSRIHQYILPNDVDGVRAMLWMLEQNTQVVQYTVNDGINCRNFIFGMKFPKFVENITYFGDDNCA